MSDNLAREAQEIDDAKKSVDYAREVIGFFLVNRMEMSRFIRIAMALGVHRPALRFAMDMENVCRFIDQKTGEHKWFLVRGDSQYLHFKSIEEGLGLNAVPDYAADWNNIAKKRGWPTVRCITPRREDKLEELESKPWWDWSAMMSELEQVSQSWTDSFPGWSFDWVIKSEDNAIKLMEGNYRERAVGGLSQGCFGVFEAKAMQRIVDGERRLARGESFEDESRYDHPEWARKRYRLLWQRGWRCEECGADSIELHAHHLRYGPTLWDVDDSDLQILCKDCHAAVHAGASNE